MKIGNHRYFNTLIEVLPVRTLVKGLCYKLFFGKALKLKALDPDPIAIFVTSSFENKTDKLEEIHVTVAENNTWQGIVEKKWPYSKVPPVFSGSFSQEFFKTYVIEIDENFHVYREGEKNFDECMKEYDTSQCVSIFDPRAFKNQ